MKLHVLVVDNSLTVRMDLRGALTSAGFIVATCDSLAQARKALQNRTYSLVILDSHLPDGSGLDLLKDVRAADRRERVPVIILSSETALRHRVLGLIQGAYEYVGKPYNKSYLVKLASALTKPRGVAADVAAELAFDNTKVVLVGSGSQRLVALNGALHRDGHEVVLAGSGEEAMHLFSVERVDAVVTDLTTPSSGGVEICRRIRGRRECRGTAIMALLARVDERSRAEGALSGIDEVCPASSDPELLKAHIRGLIRKKRLEQSARDVDDPVPSSLSAFRREEEPEPPSSLFAAVVVKSGLSNTYGPSTIARACRRVGVDAPAMTPSDLERALPAILDALSLFVSTGEAERRIASIAELTRSFRRA